ncbi:MAG: hypothetical protein OXU21_00205 [Chloroflexota bacterium]|nr:hypothetical protein [Chloroflexota bacterium]
MKTITVSVDEETYRLASVKAAERGTSVSALVHDSLIALAQDEIAEPEFNRLHRLQNETLAAIHARGGGLRSLDNLPRGDLHQRDPAAHQN